MKPQYIDASTVSDKMLIAECSLLTARVYEIITIWHVSIVEDINKINFESRYIHCFVSLYESFIVFTTLCNKEDIMTDIGSQCWGLRHLVVKWSNGISTSKSSNTFTVIEGLVFLLFSFVVKKTVQNF